MNSLNKYYENYIKSFIAKHESNPPNNFSWKGYNLKCQKYVFNPSLAHSTRVFMDYISSRNFENCSVLDAGCGIGGLMIAARLAGAKYVHGYDCSANAVDTAIINNKLLDKPNFKVEKRDNMPTIIVNKIISNPPFFNSTYQEEWHRAFFDPNRLFLKDLLNKSAENLEVDGELILILEEHMKIDSKTSEVLSDNFILEKELKIDETILNLKIVHYRKTK